MQINQNGANAVAVAAKTREKMPAQMDAAGLIVASRIDEVMLMCGRRHFLYDQIGNFAIALYVMGLLDAQDITALDDLESEEAGTFLSEYFTQISKKDLPSDYTITQSKDRYLMVIGDPLFPLHFAVLTDTQSRRPFFSKLRYFGCGFDSFEELISDFLGEDGLSYRDIRYFKMKRRATASSNLPANIYIVRDDGGYLVV